MNASPNEICEAVVVRGGQDPIVVNLDVHTPEPASAGHRGMPFHPDRSMFVLWTKMVLMDERICLGCVLQCCPAGVIEGEQFISERTRTSRYELHIDLSKRTSFVVRLPSVD